MPSDALTSPAAERNKTVIGDIIDKYFPDEQKDELSHYNALEIAAGYGAHIMYNSKRFPQIKWIVTEKDPNCIKSINAHLNIVIFPMNARVGPHTLLVGHISTGWDSVGNNLGN